MDYPMYVNSTTIASSLGGLSTGVTLSHRFQKLNETSTKDIMFCTPGQYRQQFGDSATKIGILDRDRHFEYVPRVADDYKPPRAWQTHYNGIHPQHPEIELRYRPKEKDNKEMNLNEYDRPSRRSFSSSSFGVNKGESQSGKRDSCSRDPAPLCISRERPAKQVAQMLRNGHFGGEPLGISEIVTDKRRLQEIVHGRGKRNIRGINRGHNNKYPPSNALERAKASGCRGGTRGRVFRGASTRNPDYTRVGYNYPQGRSVSKLELDTELDVYFAEKRKLSVGVSETVSSVDADMDGVDTMEVDEEPSFLEGIRECLELYES